ncbi:37111_t:CDS:2, partial [Racocetra persica]
MLDLRVDESTISCILKIAEEQLDNNNINSNTKQHKTVTYPELDLALKELEPDHTLATQYHSGHKTNKEQNANSSHKLNPLIIGKYKKPRCFKNINISNLLMTYRNSTKAWMIISLFQEWVLEFDYQVGLKYRGQCVLLLLNNCSSHDISGVTLRFTDILFLASNTTSRIQLMNASYHTKIISTNDNSGLGSLEDFCQTTDPVLNDIANALEALGLPDSINIKEFLAIPKKNVVYEVSLDNQVIIELVETFKMNNPTDTDLEDADDSLEILIVSTNMATVSLKTMLTFLLQQNNMKIYINLVERIEKFIKKTK